jgi:hypothetical protein
VAGAGIGYGVIHTWKNRATDAVPATDSTDATAPGTDPSLTPPGGTGYTGVVVPPTIIAAPSSDSTGLSDLISGFGTLIEGFGTLYGPVQSAMLEQYSSNSDTIRSLAVAGSAPQSAAVNPSPIQAAPAPAAALPSPAGSKCPPQYPYQSARGCYQVACKLNAKGKKERVHAYAGNIPDQFLGVPC